MIGLLLLFIFGVWLLWLLNFEGKEPAAVSRSIWIVLAWVFIYGTRPLTEWFVDPSQSPFLSRSRDEGNPIEALISLSLILVGVFVLLRRGIRLPEVIRGNALLFVFYLFWLISVSWSDYPLITFKRLFKDVGNIVMVLVVLTESKPEEAIRAVCSRLAYLCVPLSILFIRYYPEWGRAYVGYSQNELMWVGVTENKNALGVLAMVTAVFLLWGLLEVGKRSLTTAGKSVIASRVVVLLMSWYLLLVANSVTALICAVLGSATLVALRIPAVRRSPGRLEGFGLGAAVVLVTVDLFVDIKELFVTSLGRDMTLTTRTDVWPILLTHQDNPLVGAGFNSFWAGERLANSFETLGGIIQAHNGYLETYLNGGLIGVILLMVLLISAYTRIRRQLALGGSEGRIRFVLFLLALIYNNSEASFNKVGLMWFVTLFAIMEFHRRLRPRTTEISPVVGPIPTPQYP